MKKASNTYRSIITLIFGVPFLFLNSCSTSKSSVVWVSGVKTECVKGAGKGECLSIYKGADLDSAQWQLFYSAIDGFNFEPGYCQQIKIKEEQLPKSKVPADASSIKYTLLKTIEKRFDQRSVLNDIWVVTHIKGEAVEREKRVPQMEINLAKMQVFGNNGCNSYTGKIEVVTASELKFGPIASTKKLCMDMKVPDQFDRAMNATATYELSYSKLILMDEEGRELLTFKKVD